MLGQQSKRFACEIEQIGLSLQRIPKKASAFKCEDELGIVVSPE